MPRNVEDTVKYAGYVQNVEGFENSPKKLVDIQ